MIRNISEVRTGFNPRKKLTELSKGDTYFIQPGNLKTGGISFDHRIHAAAFPIKERHYLKKGDVLFIAKGSRPAAWVFESAGLPVVPNSSFLIIRPDTGQLLPYFLR